MCWSKVKDFLKAFDLFSQPIVLRLQESSSYETATGGLCSLILLVIFVAIFTGTALNTVQKKYISSSTTIFEENDPSYYQVGTNHFMFAVGVSGLNLNDDHQWFTIELKFKSYSADSRVKDSLPLVACTREHWTSVEEKFGEIYDRFGFEEWLCPTKNSTFELQGKYTSQIFKFYEIKIKECVDEGNRTCVNHSVIEDYLAEDTFKLSFYFVNTIINAGNPEYLSYYLEDMNYFEFTDHAGVNANIFISAYKISTDESIYPVEDIRNDTGGVVNKLAQVHNFQVLGDEYVRLYLRKSSTDIYVERSFRKADDTISYIGGLFSVIVVLMFTINAYNETCYEVEVAKSILRDDQGHPIHSNNFNLFTYFSYSCSQFLEFFGCSPICQHVAVYSDALDEIRKQMDVRLMMKRLGYCEKGIQILLEDHRAKVLHLQRPLTLDEVQDLRKEYELYDEMEEFIDRRQFLMKDQEEESNSEVKMNRSNMVSPIEIAEFYEKNEWSQDNEEQEELKQKIRKIKVHVGKLQKEVKQGNQLSEKVLDKFCEKLKKLFTEKKTHKVIENHRQSIPQISFEQKIFEK